MATGEKAARSAGLLDGYLDGLTIMGDRPFNNLLADVPNAAAQDIDFAMHARSLGAEATKVGSIAELEAALERAEGASFPGVEELRVEQRARLDAHPIGALVGLGVLGLLLLGGTVAVVVRLGKKL